MAAAGVKRDRETSAATGPVVLPALALSLVLVLVCLPVPAQVSIAEARIPSFAELEAAGAVIGKVRIDNQNIFNLEDPKENNALFRLANRLHIPTRPSAIRRSLLFRSGERVSRQRIEESERLLRSYSYLYDVTIRPIAYRDGVVDLEVRTRDTWTLTPGASFSRGGGSNRTELSLKEQNLFGSGVAIGVSRDSTVDRSSREFEIQHKQLFGNWTAFEYKTAKKSDGSAHSFSLARPFYALDTRWALGVSTGRFDQIDSIYTNGDIVGQYRHLQQSGGVFGGWSNGLVGGWVQRYTVGIGYQDDAYQIDPTRPAPAQLPPDQTLAYPFVRYELLEDGFVKVVNRDKIGRAEYIALGLSSQVQLGRTSSGLGSTRDLWLYSGAINKGFRTSSGADLLGGITLSGQYGDGRGERQFYGASTRYYQPHGTRGLFYAAASVDAVRNPLVPDQLLLGGDNGLRGYPLRYQSGNQRALLTLEERVYTDWYLFRLIRVGGAVFFDTGRAWGGPFENLANPGWLSDLGVGLRLLNDRTSSSNVLHIDLAFPLNPDPNIKKVQFLVKAYLTF